MRRILGHDLWLGHAGDARDVPALLDAGITAVVALALDEPPIPYPRDLTSCRFPLLDGAGNPAWLLRSAVATVADLLREGVPTLVLCGAGLSRSPAVAGAALARFRNCAPAEGLSLVTHREPADVSLALWAEILAAVAAPWS